MQSKEPDYSLKVIRGGTVFNSVSGELEAANVFIENGFIKEISSAIPPEGCSVLDATNCIVSPGFIDMHVHFREPGFEIKEDMQSGSDAAAAGGFTTVVCMPNTDPVNDSPETSEYILERAKKSKINIIPAGALSKKSKGHELSDIEGMVDVGVRVFSDDGSCIQDRPLMQRAMESVHAKGGLVIDHAEDFTQSGDGQVNEGSVSESLNLLGISRDSEIKIVKRDIELARETGTKIHLAHLSTSESVELVRNAKKQGINVTCEVTPHHLTLTEDAVERLGTNAKVKPPLRTKEDHRALISGLADGTIDVIATDHAPHEDASKNVDFKDAAFGVIGLETMLSVCLSLVHQKKISLERLLNALTERPAQILGLSDVGTLVPGKRADITIFSLDSSVTIDSRKFQSKSRNCPFDGLELRGKVIKTIKSGEIIYSV